MTVTVTDVAGMKCSWTTAVTVSVPLVYIEYIRATYTLVGTYILTLNSSYDYNVWIDGSQVVYGGVHSDPYIASMRPGSTHTIQVQILGNPVPYNWFADDKGPVSVPLAIVKSHCFLSYSTYDHSFVDDGSVTTFNCVPE